MRSCRPRCRLERGDPGAEGSCRIFCVTIGDDGLDPAPGRVRRVWLASTAGDVHHLMARFHEPGDEIRSDVPASPDDDNLGHFVRNLEKCDRLAPVSARNGNYHELANAEIPAIVMT